MHSKMISSSLFFYFREQIYKQIFSDQAYSIFFSEDREISIQSAIRMFKIQQYKSPHPIYLIADFF